MLLQAFQGVEDPAIAKQLYKKAEKSIENSIERKYVDSLLDWY